MTYTEKMVEFYKYCKKCKHEKLPDGEEPCNSCLTEPVNEDSVIPVKFEPKESVK